MRLPIFDREISGTWSTDWLFSSHVTDIGRSPPRIVHWTEAGSPKFNGSSPKSNGDIFGGTEFSQFHHKNANNRERSIKSDGIILNDGMGKEYFQNKSQF